MLTLLLIAHFGGVAVVTLALAAHGATAAAPTLLSTLASYASLAAFILIYLPIAAVALMLTRSGWRDKLDLLKTSAITALQAEVGSLRNQMADQRERLLALESKVPALEAQLHGKEAEISRLKERISELEALVAVRADELREKDAAIERLRAALHQSELDRNDLARQLAEAHHHD